MNIPNSVKLPFATEKSSTSQPPELTSLDARIANTGGTSSTIELQTRHLQQTKNQANPSESAQLKQSIRENGHLRQEIIFYQESRNAMMAFHNQALQAYQMQQSALQELSEKMALAEGRLEKYWGITLKDLGNEDLSVI